MNILKRVAIVFAALLLLAAAVFAYLAATFDAARIKQEAAQAVLAKTGRTLTIEGDLALKFWPSLGVDVARASLSEHESKQFFASLDAAHVSVRVLPLLSKKIVVDSVDIDGLKLTLVKDRDGHLNIDDLLGSKQPSGATAPPPEFDVAGIHINNAQLTWRDERANSTLKIADLDFVTGHAVGGKDGLTVDGLRLSTAGKLDADSFTLALDVPGITRKGEQFSAVKVGIKATLKGAARNAVVSLDLSNIEGTLQSLKMGGLALGLDAAMGDKKIKGSLATPLALDMESKSLLLPTISGGFDVDMPGLPARPLRLPISGRIKAEYGKPAVSGNLLTAFDETHIDARFNVVFGASANIGLELDIDKLNVDKYLPPTADKQADDRVDLSALKRLNASGTLRVGELQVKNIKARNVRVSFNAAHGKVDIAPHSADLYGGQVSGSASLNASSNRIALKESLRGINVDPLIKDIAGKEMIEGRGDVSLDIATQGDTVTAMKKSLSGTAGAVLRDGAIKGINIAQTLRSAKAKLGGDVTQAASATDKTDFSELSASFKIANGVARNDDLAAKSPFLRLGGNGDIDIGNSQLNYVLKASVVGTAAGQGGKETDALKGLTVPVRVSGPFDKPAFKLELANLVSDAAKARLEDKKQEIKEKTQQKVQDQLKGKLKGLF